MKPLTLILGSYIIGIIVFDNWLSDYDIFYYLLIGILISTSFIIKGLKTFNPFRKVFSISTFLFWFLAGGIQVHFQQLSSHADYYENISVEEDSFLVKLKDVSLTSTKKFYKAIGEIEVVMKATDTVSTSGNILAFLEVSEEEPLQRNDYILLKAQLKNFENKGNVGEFDAKRYWKYKQIDKMVFVFTDNYTRIGQAKFELQDIFLNCRDFLGKIIDKNMSGQEAAVTKGLVLGDRSSIESETTQTFSSTGAMHVLAVSGMHVAILVLILNWILQRFPKYINKRTAVIISLCIVWFYSLMTGFSPSVSRAAWMFTFLTGGTLLHRNYHPVNGLLFSALLILLWNPYALFDIGFQLSYCAMIGIFTVFPYLRKQLVFKNNFINNIWEGTALGIAAQLFTTPFALYYFHQFPNYFWITNIALSAYGTIILAGGLLLFTANFIPILAKGLGFVLSFVLFSMLWLMRTIESLPDSVSQGFTIEIGVVLLLYLVISTFFYSILQKKLKLLITTLLVAMVMVIQIVHTRYINTKTDRLVIFNEQSPVLLLKKQNQSFAFYDSTKITQQKTAILTASFQKVYPSKNLRLIHFSNEKNIKIAINEWVLQLENQTGGFFIHLPNEKFFFRTTHLYGEEQSKTILAANLEDDSAFHELKSGAFNHLILP